MARQRRAVTVQLTVPLHLGETEGLGTSPISNPPNQANYSGGDELYETITIRSNSALGCFVKAPTLQGLKYTLVGDGAQGP